MIDFAVGYSPERIEEDVKAMLKEELYVDNSDELFERPEKARTLLYLTDNCGEVYFDRLFVGALKKSLRG